MNAAKTCGTCRAIKSLADFHKNKSARDGLTTRCKACAIAAAKASYERRKRAENPQIDLVREHRARLAEARSNGHKFFTPLLACPAGHLTQRYTATQFCRQCYLNRRRAPEREADRLAKKRSAVKRDTARKLGQTHYLGSPCLNGHDGKRLVSTRQCVECLNSRPSSGAAKLSVEAERRKNARRRSRAGRAKQRRYQSEVLQSRPAYKVQRFMYESIRRILNGSGEVKRSRTVELLGYGRARLMARIECQFKPGMSWANYGAWHIDHRKPICAFIAAGETRPEIINALCNLQPLWACENMSKGGKRAP